MATPNYIVQLPKECTQSWEEMHAGINGKFCQHCSKHVTDFTNLGDEEIIKAIQQAEGKLCGRLHTHQLNRVLMPAPVYKQKHNRFREILAALLLLISTREASAHDTGQKPQIVSQPLKPEVKDVADNIDTAVTMLRGIVIDSVTRQPIPFASITNLSKTIFATTDSDGYFKIKASIGDLMYIGGFEYTARQFKVTSTAQPLFIEMVIDTTPREIIMGKMMMGEIMYVPPPQPTIKEKVKNFFTPSKRKTTSTDRTIVDF